MATVDRVQKRPDLGRIRRDLNPNGIRSVVIRRYPRYLLFYLWQQETIEVLRIKHGMMDIPKLFA
jgi:plasmid stabilization system protein ParE